MILAVDEQLRREAKQFKFAFACPSCAWFAVESRTCALGYPNGDHLDAELDQRESVVFCKTFELS